MDPSVLPSLCRYLTQITLFKRIDAIKAIPICFTDYLPSQGDPAGREKIKNKGLL